MVFVTQQQAISASSSCSCYTAALCESSDFLQFLTWSCSYSPSRHFHSSRTSVKPWGISWSFDYFSILTANPHPVKRRLGKAAKKWLVHNAMLKYFSPGCVSHLHGRFIAQNELWLVQMCKILAWTLVCGYSLVMTLFRHHLQSLKE